MQVAPFRSSIMIVTAVLAALAAGCGGSADPNVAFDGETCTYSGPATFDAGTLPAFVVSNESSTDMQMVIYQIGEGLTYDDVVAVNTGLTLILELPEGISARSSSGVVAPDSESTVNVGFSEPGNYLPGCKTMVPEVDEREAFLTGEFITVP